MMMVVTQNTLAEVDMVMMVTVTPHLHRAQTMTAGLEIKLIMRE